METKAEEISRLRREIGERESRLQWLVLGDPRIGTVIGPEGSYQTLNGVRLCSDCPPDNYPTNKTRCDQCPRRQ